MRIIGIDPGLTGGIAAIDLDYKVLFAELMPVAGNVIDCARLADFWRERNGAFVDPSFVFIEKVHSMPKQGVSSGFKFGTVYGQVIGMCQALGWPIELVTPQQWKKVTLKGTKRDKDAAIQHVTLRYPNVELIPGLCRTPQDGIADAVCIAEYGMQKVTSQI